MELFFAATFVSMATGVVASAWRTRKVENSIRWTPQTKIERLHEQKILGRWIIKEITEMMESKNVSKEQVAELLHKLSVFASSSTLKSFSKDEIRDIIEAAYNALHFIEKADPKYIFLLNRVVERVVQAVLRTAGEKESGYQFLKTMESLRGLKIVFRKFSGDEDEVTQWKNEAQNKKLGK